MKRQNNKFITVLMVLALMLGAGVIYANADPTFAGKENDDENVVIDVPLDVYYDDVLIKSYSPEEFKSLYRRFPSGFYTYSGFSSFPTAKIFDQVAGVKVEVLLRDALGDEGFENIKGDQVIKIIGRDTITERFLKSQLFMDRYYYPRINQEIGRCGKAILPSSADDAQSVPPVMSLTEEGNTFDQDPEVGRVLFGQISPHEQNHPAVVKYVTPQCIKVKKGREHSISHSKIIICKESGAQWNPIQETSETKGSTLGLGTELTLDLSVNDFNKNGSGRYWVYYTLDGSTPTTDSDIYNYNSFAGNEQKFNKPVLTEYGKVVLKTIVCGYGKKDSKVSTFCFTVSPEAPSIKKLSLKKKAITVSWKATADAEGYQIQRSMKKRDGFKTVKTIKGGKTCSWKNTGLKKGKTYYYRVRAYRMVEGNNVYSSYSAVKNKKVK